MTTLLYALGLDQEGICDYFYDTVTYRRKPRARLDGAVLPERLRGTKPCLRSGRRGRRARSIVEAGKKHAARKLAAGGGSAVEQILVPFEMIYGRYAAEI